MNSDPRRESFTVPSGGKSRRLDRWLAEQMSGFSRSAVQRLIRDGHVRVSGRRQTKSGANLRPRDTVEVEIPPPSPAALLAQPIALDIVFEDDTLLVLNKPAGMVVHPAAGNRQGTLVNALLHHCRGLSAIGGVERPGIVHRLDKLTSGLMVVAKTDATHRNLAAQLARRSMKRTYLAVVWGQPQPPEGTIDAPIGRHPRDRKRMAVVSKGGRNAVTHYRTAAAAGGLALLEVSLQTGRTHQIRVHLRHIGYPVVGDDQYGLNRRQVTDRLSLLPPALSAAISSVNRQLLHAQRLQFTHPVTGSPLEFEATLPDDLARTYEAIKKAQSGSWSSPSSKRFV